MQWIAALLISTAGWLENVTVDGGATAYPPPTPKMMRLYLDHATADLAAARRARLDAMSAPADFAAYRDEKRAYLLEALGGFPERTPLNAQVVGQGAGEGYRFEKILFESQPGFHVTGVLFLPSDTSKPVPGVIVPCGHSANGKAMESYQRASILLAKNGIASFCYDPIGQGERYFYLKEDGTPELGATVEHTMIGVSAILTGTNTAMFRIWDGMRALDYLESRPEIDPKRLGCTGNSGGGTLTSYLMALDDRIQCAAVSCYLTSFERLLGTIGPQDAEQNVFGQIAAGIDHGDYILMRAPKPTLICSATKDFFDIQGTWDTFRAAKRVYSKLGFSERVDLIENLDEHGFHKPQREAMVRWMRRWLAGVEEVVVEAEFPIHTDADLQCSPQGQVKLMPGERTVFDLLRDRAAQLASTREALWQTADHDTLRAKISTKAGYAKPAFAVPRYQHAATATANRTRLHIYPEIAGPGMEDAAGAVPLAHDIVLEATLCAPQGPATALTLCLRPEGMRAMDAEEEAIQEDAAKGAARLYLDLRGTGKTAPDDPAHGWEESVGAEWPSYFRAYLVGKSYTGMWVTDTVAAAGAARHLLGNAALPVQLDARGMTTIPAAHAAALEPSLMRISLLQGGLPSWHAAIAAPRTKHLLFSSVHGALSLYDIDLLAILGGTDAAVIQHAPLPSF
jgi:cephalosporin-C deacetylase-like acetyl esterase